MTAQKASGISGLQAPPGSRELMIGSQTTIGEVGRVDGASLSPENLMAQQMLQVTQQQMQPVTEGYQYKNVMPQPVTRPGGVNSREVSNL